MGSCQSHLESQVCPRWDPTRDYGTSRMGSHMGSRLEFLKASHLRKHIPGGMKPGVPPIPLGILPQISDSFPPGETISQAGLHLGSCQSQFRLCIKFQMASHFQKILSRILFNTEDHRFMKCTRWEILSIPFVT